MDAEGCVSVAFNKKTNRWAINIDFGQTRAEAIKVVHEHFGGSLRVDDKPLKKNWAPKLCLRISAQDSVRDFICKVLPYSQEKREQLVVVEKLLSFSTDDVEAGVNARHQLTEIKQRVISIPIQHSKEISSAPSCSRCDQPAVYVKRRLCKQHYFAERYQQKKTGNWSKISRVLPFTYLETPSTTALQYIAGFFDGDGNLFATAKSLRIQFGQTRPEGIDFISKFYGGTRTFRRRKGKRRPIVYYKLSREEAVKRFLLDVEPYLLEKREEVQVILKGWRRGMPTRKLGALKRKIAKARGKKVH